MLFPTNSAYGSIPFKASEPEMAITRK